MPFPQNIEMARNVESIIREEGAEPATIAILDGIVRIGLEDADLMRLAKLPRNEVTKSSRRDIALV
jgi:pseudouridine-5'-phosphate glycosidase